MQPSRLADTQALQLKNIQRNGLPGLSLVPDQITQSAQIAQSDSLTQPTQMTNLSVVNPKNSAPNSNAPKNSAVAGNESSGNAPAESTQKVILAIDGGNGSLKWATNIEGKTKAGSVPNLLLQTPHPQAGSVDGNNFVYGVMAAKLDLAAAFNPGRTGSHSGKVQNLPMVIAAAVTESGLVNEESVTVDLRLATPLNCQLGDHKALEGQSFLVKAPATRGGGSVLINVDSVTSYQECRPLLSSYDGVIDLGSGTSFYGWNNSHGQPVLKSFENGVGALIEAAVDDCKISERVAELGSAVKGVLSPEGLSASLASGKAIGEGGSIKYKGVEFSDVLKPLVARYWNETVKRAIAAAINNTIPRKDTPVIAVVGGGAALVQAVLQRQELDAAAPADAATIKFLRRPALQLVTAMASAE